MRVKVGAKTDVGRIRERNEDAYLINEPLYAVADGMGGHRGGDVASSMTLEALQEVALPQQAPLGKLLEEIKKANVEVLRRGDADSDLRGMGTTLTAFLKDDDKGYIAHIGDSRAYLLRDGSVQRLTRDHTLVERMVEEGRLQPEQARNHPQQNILTRVLGVEDNVEVDDLTLDPIQPGDRILLCTDGLSHMVGDDTIEGILQEEADPQAAADRLVDAAIEAGGEDNVTVIVLDVEEGDPDLTVAAEIGGASTSQADPDVAPASPPPAGPDVTAVHEAVEVEADDDTYVDDRPRRRGRRLLKWVAVVVVLLVVAVIGVRFYANQQWYVSDNGQQVAIYHGIPTTVLGFDLSHLAAMTDLTAAEVEQVPFWKGRLRTASRRTAFRRPRAWCDRCARTSRAPRERPRERGAQASVSGRRTTRHAARPDAARRHPVGGAYLLVTMGRTGKTPADVGGFVAAFGLAYLGAHLLIRRFAPAADPTLFPTAALLAGLGYEMIYRLNLGQADAQFGWLVVGLVLFAARWW